MSDNNNRSEQKQQPAQRGTFIERLMRKTLSSVGGVFERKSSGDAEGARLPSTSDLTERLKKLIDAGVREQKDGSRIAPHLIRLKYTWGETTDEFEANLARLKNEMLVVAIDHINDNRYRTIEPVKIEVKPDILSQGFTLAVGFDASNVAEAEKVEIPAEIFAGLLPQDNTPQPQKPSETEVAVSAEFPNGNKRSIKLHFIPNGKSNLTIGRSKENDLFLDDKSVSKLHASLVLSAEGKLRVADVGSTNGTHIDKERISYGRAYEITPETEVAFGEVKCSFEWDLSQFEVEAEPQPTVENDFSQTVEDIPEESETVFSNEPETVVGNSIENSNNEPETVRKSSNDVEFGEPITVFNRLKKDSANVGETLTDFTESKADDEKVNSSNRTD
jgi:pSer/pThr/pTyr-binding forkhead associated (FHA) protein